MQDKETRILAKQCNEEGQIKTEAQINIDNCLHICLQLTANLAILANPFLPFTAKKLCYLMKVVENMLDWENAGSKKLLSTGYSLRAPELLFRKMEDEEVALQIEKLSLKSSQLMDNNTTGKSTTEAGMADKNTATADSAKAVIQFDDFAKIDLKTGTITAAEKVEKADKLLKLEVDLGFEKRTIVSGIAQHFEPAAIIGQKVVVVTNHYCAVA